MLAGLALLSTIGGSLYQALHNERERDAAVVAFLVTASGLTLFGIGFCVLGINCRRRLLRGVEFNR